MSVENPRQAHPTWERRSTAATSMTSSHSMSWRRRSSRSRVAARLRTGHAAIREVLGQLLGLKAQIQLRTAAVVERGDVALVYGEWSMTGGTDPDGNRVDMEARSTEILRRQADGSWLYLVDDPFSRG